ncbi:MAG: hypothetical protein SGJ10_08700 [Bacteroidota bacterium]|nr:hypothetical protein [Bacteroidota bacterium]
MYHKFTFLAFFFCLSLGSNSAQSIQLIMSSSPSPYISDWPDRAETATLIINNTGTSDLNVKVRTELFDSRGVSVAATDASKMPILTVPPGVNQYNPDDIFPLYAVNYKGSLEKTMSRTGRIPDDHYKFEVTITDPLTGATIGTSGSTHKMFNIVSYQAPILQTPGNTETISDKNINNIIFRWTPVIPSPREIVTYRLKVFEVMDGQDYITAIRSNQAIIEKDYKGVYQTQWPNDYPLPEVGKKYAWTVTPMDGEDRQLVDGYGFAQPFWFNIVTQYIIELDSFVVKCTDTPGQYTFSYIITNLNNSTAVFQNISVYSSTPGGATISSFSPPLGTPIAPSGGTLTVTGIISASPSLSNICIKTKIQKLGDPGKNAEDYLCDSNVTCKCDACDSKYFTLAAPAPNQIDINNNTISLVQPVTITTSPPKTIKTIKADLVYFEMVPENDLCIPCNKDALTYGHFTNGTNSQQWNGVQQNLIINITTPQLTPCCSALFRWCIRYKIEFTDCTTCNKLVCYEKKKQGCAQVDPTKNTK